MASPLLDRLVALADPAIAEHSGRFFRSGPGEYGEGDRFLGIRVPTLRAEARRSRDLSLKEAKSLLKSDWHEVRLCALLALVDQFARGDAATREAVFQLYWKQRDRVNNWDLVDSSAPQIVGGYLERRDRAPLYELAKSERLWDRRIAILATLHFIRKNDFADTLRLADALLRDEEDLMHKAVGWMLREVGNRDHATEVAFLLPRYRSMPRTLLRYAIEKFPEAERLSFLKGTR